MKGILADINVIGQVAYLGQLMQAVFTIADLDRFGTSREYAERVAVTLYDYLLRIDEVRGTGRLFFP